VEPLAPSVVPSEVSARHQPLHHFVAQSDCGDVAVLDRVVACVMPTLGRGGGEVYWSIDDTALPKKGRRSVGVVRQFCGILGKQDNCQVAVSLSVTTAPARLPVAWRLCLPKAWAEHRQRCEKAGVPGDIGFATGTQLALGEARAARVGGLSPGGVVADAGDGNEQALRAGITALGLSYMLAVKSHTNVWAPAIAPLPPPPYSGRGRPPVRHRTAEGHCPLSVEPAGPVLVHREVARRHQTGAVVAVCGRAGAGGA